MNTGDFFDRRARSWDEENPVPEHRIERVIEHCGLRRGDHVLDVGTGTGRLIPSILQRVGCRGSICGLDPSSAMLAVAREKHPQPNVVFTQAPAEDMPFDDESFHVVICHAVFPHFHDPGAALAEIHRVLVPHGQLIIAHTNGRDEINRRHRGAGAEVESDILPPAREVAGMMQTAGIIPRRAIDGEDLYLVSGTKSVVHDASGR